MNIKEAKLIMEVLEELGPIQNQHFGSIERILITGCDDGILYLDITLDEVNWNSLLAKKLKEAWAVPNHEFNCWCVHV